MSAALAAGACLVLFGCSCSEDEGRGRPESDGGVTKEAGPDAGGGSGGRGGEDAGNEARAPDASAPDGEASAPEGGADAADGRVPDVLAPGSTCEAWVPPSGVASPLPPLTRSSPVEAESDVPRTAWVSLTFDAAVSDQAAGHVRLECDTGAPDFEVSVVNGDTVVLNPCGSLPVGDSCRVSWAGPSGAEEVSFTVAADGAPATLRYDRNDTTRMDPFPDDFYLVDDPSTRTGKRVDVRLPDTDPAVRNVLLAGTDGVKSLDGMSPIGLFVVALPEAVDPASVPLTAQASLHPLATVGLFDIDPASPDHGRRVPFDALLRSETNAQGVVEHTLLVFPSAPLRPRGRYAFAVTSRVLVDRTRPVEASAFFRTVVGGAAATADELRLAGSLASVMSELAATSPPLRADDLALALGITVRSVDEIPSDLLAIRERTLAAAAPTFTVTSSGADPTAGSDVAAIVRGTFTPPSFRDGDFVRRDASGVPVPQGTVTIPFTLAIPRSAELTPAPLVFYQHGQPGSAEAEVPRAARRGLARAGFAVIGFTDLANRDIIPTGDVVALNTQSLITLLGSHDMPDYLSLLTHAEQLSFLRVLPQLGAVDVLPLGAPDGAPDLDPLKPLSYLGISQGSIHGVGFLAFAPEIHAAALTAGGGRLCATLVHQASEALYQGIAAVFPALTRTELYEGLSLVQMIYDRQDPLNLGRHLYREPLALGAASRASVLLTEGIGDSLVPNYATRSAAAMLGIPQLAPASVPVPFLAPAAAPLTANIDAATTAAFFQYVPSGSTSATPTPGCVTPDEPEGHYCAQVADEAIRQRLDFFSTAQAGVPRIVDPALP